MVDRPRLAPQAIRGSSREVPTLNLGQVTTNLRSVPTVRPTGLEAQARAFGVEASAISQATQILQASTQDIIAKLQDTQRTEAERIYAESALEIEQSLQQVKKNIDPETDNFPEAAMGAYDAAVDRQLDREDLSDFQKEVLRGRYDGQRFNVAKSSVAYQANLQLKMQNLDYERYSEAQLNRLRSDPALLDQIIVENADFLAASDFTAIEKEGIARELDEAVSATYVSGLIANDRLGDAKSVLGSDDFKQRLDPKAYTALNKDLKVTSDNALAQAEREQKQAHADFISQLELRVSRNQASYEELDALLTAEGVNSLTQQEHTRFSKMLDVVNKDKVLNAQADAVIYSKISSGETLTESDRESFERVYDEQFLPSIAGADPAVKQARKAEFIIQSGLMPRSERNNIKASLLNGDPESKLEAAALVEQLQEANPFFDTKLEAEDIALAARLNSARMTNVDAASAVEEVKQDALNPARTKQFKDAFEAKFNYTAMTAEIIDKLDARWMGEPELLPETGQREKVVAETRALAMKYFKTNPDYNKAISFATNEISKTWADVKSPGGTRVAMKYAPQTRYPELGGNHQWINSQLEEDIKAEGIEFDDVFLVSDPLTEQEVPAGRLPGYSVYIMKDEQIELLPGVRFRPDIDKARASVIEEVAEDRARRQRLFEELERTQSVREGF